MEELSMVVEDTEIADKTESVNETVEITEVTSHEREQHVYQYPTLFTGKTLLELCSSSWTRSLKANDSVQPFLKGCKWSPDGTCCLSVVNNDGMHLSELPRDLYTDTPSSDRTIDILDSVVHVKECGLIYDFCWYPGMNSSIPESCCWITTRQNGPIQMWDAFDGSLRCTYRGFNAVDEMEPAFSVTFNVEGSRIIAGYKKHIRTFDVERPGRDFAEHKISSSASCFATSSNLIAVGSWNSTINLYNINEMGGYKSIGKMHGHAGGVTHMKFTPDGIRLVSGARKDHRLLVWDIRYYRRPLNVLNRPVDTNQRIYFDVSPCGNYLVSGGTDGILKVWDVNKVNWKSSLNVTEDGSDNATYKFPLHNDCCNSVSIHPLRPILATGSGQYHFRDPISSLDDEDKTNNDDETKPQKGDEEREQNGVSCAKDSNDITNGKLHNDSEIMQNKVDMRYSSEPENSLVFWWIGEMVNSECKENTILNT